MQGPWTEATLSLVITEGPRVLARGGLTGGADEFQIQASGPQHSPTEPDTGQEPEPSFHDVVAFKGHAPPWALGGASGLTHPSQSRMPQALGKDGAILPSSSPRPGYVTTDNYQNTHRVGSIKSKVLCTLKTSVNGSQVFTELVRP